MNESPRCLLCGRTDLQKALTTSDLLRGRPEFQATFMECNFCGLFFQQPLPGDEAMSQHYSEDYLTFFNTERSPGAPPGRGSRRQIGYLEKHLNQGDLLDVGAGTGSFLAGLTNSDGWTVTGLEPDPRAAAFAREQYGLTIIESTLEAVHFDPASFDGVTLWDVLEHLPNPAEALEEIFHILRPGGWVIIRVPNPGGWEAALFGLNWAGWDVPRHISAFAPKTLEFALKQAGFEPQPAAGGAEDYSSFAISVQFWERQGRGDKPGRGWAGSLVKSGLVHTLAYPLFWISGRTSRGSRLIVAAQKPALSSMQEAA